MNLVYQRVLGLRIGYALIAAFIFCTNSLSAQSGKALFTHHTDNKDAYFYNQTHPDTAIDYYVFDFGDGTIDSLRPGFVSYQHSYIKDGSYTACLKAIENSGAVQEHCETVDVKTAPQQTQCMAVFYPSVN